MRRLSTCKNLGVSQGFPQQFELVVNIDAGSQVIRGSKPVIPCACGRNVSVVPLCDLVIARNGGVMCASRKDVQPHATRLVMSQFQQGEK